MKTNRNHSSVIVSLLDEPIIYYPNSLLNPVPYSTILQRQKELLLSFISILEQFGSQLSGDWLQLCEQYSSSIQIYEQKKELPIFSALSQLSNQQFKEQFFKYMGFRFQKQQDNNDFIIQQVLSDSQNLSCKSSQVKSVPEINDYVLQLNQNLKQIVETDVYKCFINNLNVSQYSSEKVNQFSLQGDAVFQEGQQYQLFCCPKFVLFPFIITCCDVNFQSISRVDYCNSSFLIQSQSNCLIMMNTNKISQSRWSPTNYQQYLQQYKVHHKMLKTNYRIITRSTEPVIEYDFYMTNQYKFNLNALHSSYILQQDGISLEFLDYYCIDDQFLFLDKEKVTKYNPLTNAMQHINHNCNGNIIMKAFSQNLVFVANSKTCTVIDFSQNSVSPVPSTLDEITKLFESDGFLFVCGKLIDQYQTFNTVIQVFEIKNVSEIHSQYIIGGRGGDVVSLLSPRKEDLLFFVSVSEMTNLFYFQLQRNQKSFQVANHFRSSMFTSAIFRNDDDFVLTFSQKESVQLIFSVNNISDPIAVNYNLHNLATTDACCCDGYFFVGTNESLEILRYSDNQLNKIRVFGIIGGVKQILKVINSVYIFAFSGDVFVFSH